MSVISVNKDNFNAVIATKNTVLLDFYADWCGPCRMMSPIVDEIAEEREDITVGKVNVDESPELAVKFGIVSIPTLIIIKDGKESKKIVGLRGKAEILSALE